MLIRSQDKEILVNFNVSAGIEIAEGTTKTVVTSYITGCSYLLGEYSTKKKSYQGTGHASGSLCGRRVSSNDSSEYWKDVHRSASIERK